MDDVKLEPDAEPGGPETQLGAAAATSERRSRTSRSAVDALQKQSDQPATAGHRGDGSRRGSRSHRSGSSTPQPKGSSRRHKDRSQGDGSPGVDVKDRDEPQGRRQDPDEGGRPRALLSCCKGETHSHREGFRRLARRLHDAGWQPEKLNPRAASLADGPVTPKALQGAALAVFGCPTRAFTPKETAALHAFVDQGGSLAVFACAADSSEADVSTNLNELLGRYGITVNRDALFSIVQQVLRPQQGALRPREVLVSEGALCAAVTAAAEDAGDAAGVNTAVRDGAEGFISYVEGVMPQASRRSSTAAPAAAGQQEAAGRPAELLYSDGCTLAVTGAAQPLLLSGSMCNPPQRPLAAAWRGERGGAVAVFGSAAVFDGEAMQRPGNAAAACDLLFRWLRPGSEVDLGLPPTAAKEPKARRRPLDIVEQSERPRVCFQLEPPLPGDWTQLFADDLFEFALQLPASVQQPGEQRHQNSWDGWSTGDWHGQA